MLTEIPKGDYDSPAPCWIPVTTYGDAEHRPCKPLIKCRCWQITGIGLHHVHPDGTVTASYFHSDVAEFQQTGKAYRHAPGCGWHVWLKLKDYNQGEFPPVS